MRPDLDLTDEEFMKFLEESFTDEDIEMMFENVNIEKDDQLGSDTYILTNDQTTNQDNYSDWLDFCIKHNQIFNIKNSFITPKNKQINSIKHINFISMLTPKKNAKTTLTDYIKISKTMPNRFETKVKKYKYTTSNTKYHFNDTIELSFELDSRSKSHKRKEEVGF